MVVLAPPLFSITNGWPSCFESCWPMIRDMMSAVPPAPYGTTMRTDRFGQEAAADCPAAKIGSPSAAPPATAAPALTSARRRLE